jgi:hypothetical protein
MKKLLFGIICFFAIQSVNAQITGGVKLGLSTNDITQQDVATFRNDTDSLKLALTDAGFGLHGGLFLRIPLTDRFYVQAEPMLGSSRFNYTLDSISASTGAASEIKDGYETFLNLDIPLMVGVQVDLPADIKLRAQAGFVASLVLSSQSDLLDSEGYAQKWDAMRWGYLLGAGLDFGKITVDVNFNGSLSKFGNDVTIGTEQFAFDTRPSSTVITVGYKLFGAE